VEFAWLFREECRKKSAIIEAAEISDDEPRERHEFAESSAEGRDRTPGAVQRVPCVHHSVNASVKPIHFECVVTVVRRHEGFDGADARLRIGIE